MNDKDREILNELQDGIPLSERPFLDIAQKLNVSEEQVLDCLRRLKEDNLIRRFGGILDVNKLGVVSTLACIKTDSKNIEAVAKCLNNYEGVTHNYQRDDDYNIWFTLMESSQQELEKRLRQIQSIDEVDELITLPAIRKYKTKVYLKF